MGVWGSKEGEQQPPPSHTPNVVSVSLNKDKDPWSDVVSPTKPNGNNENNNGFLSEADRQRLELGSKLQRDASPPLIPSFHKNLSSSEKKSISDKVPFSSIDLNTPLKYIGSILDDEEPFQRTSLPPTSSAATPVSTPAKQLSVGSPTP